MTTPMPIASAGQVRAHLRRRLFARPWLLVGTAAVLLLASSAGLVGPLAIGAITQAVLDHVQLDPAPIRQVVLPALALAAVAVIGALAAWLGARLLAVLVFPVVTELRTGVVDTVLDLPLDRIDEADHGDLLSRVTGDVETVTETSQGVLAEFLGAALTIGVTIAGLFTLDWRFALAGLLAVPIQAHTLRWYLRHSGPVFAGARQAAGHRTGALLSSFGALPTIRSYRLGDRRAEEVAVASAGAMARENAVMKMAGRFYGRLNLAEYLGLAAILAVGFALVRSGVATVGEATSAALFFAALFNPINIALGVFDEIQAAGAGLARLVGILQQPTGTRGTCPVPAGPATVTVSGVSFAYSTGADVVRDVDLVLAAGTSTAVVGTTGSGKSTLAGLIAGLRPPDRGTIRLGDRYLTDFEPEALHRAVPLVAQDTHVFVGTVEDNLRLADPAATSERLRQVIGAVGADGWVDALPESAATQVGAGGYQLTTAQAQHLALARILLLDPALVILDEATAEAGSDAGRGLDRAAATVIAGRTCLVIAHRLSQAAAADRIIVLEHGQIVEDGPHHDLLAAGGRYHQLWAAWAGG